MPTLDALVRTKLTSFPLEDKVHLLDLLDVGLIDESWCGRLPPEIAARPGEPIEERHREGSSCGDPDPLTRLAEKMKRHRFPPAPDSRPDTDFRPERLFRRTLPSGGNLAII